MPVSLTMIVAPVVLLSMMPPVGPGRSLITIVFCSVVCSTMFGSPGTPASASAGTSAAMPHQPPTQIGTIRIALLELHPDARADLRHHERAHLLAGDRHGRASPRSTA